jgi:cell division topological specificity factor
MISLSALMNHNRSKSAGLAKDRLQIILALERSEGNSEEPNYLPELRGELVAVVSRYVKTDPTDVTVNFERLGSHELLEVKVEFFGHGQKGG